MSVLQEENDSIFDRCFDLMENGVDLNGLLVYLHDQGATVIEAWYISAKLYGGMDKAGRAIVTHPSWQADIKALDSKPNSLAEWLIRLKSTV